MNSCTLGLLGCAEVALPSVCGGSNKVHTQRRDLGSCLLTGGYFVLQSCLLARFCCVLSQEGQGGSLWSKSAVAGRYESINHVFMDDFKDQDGGLLAGFVLRVGGSGFHSPLVLLSGQKARLAVVPNAVVSWLEPFVTSWPQCSKTTQSHTEINEPGRGGGEIQQLI